MLWDLGVMDMPTRILREKLLLYHHLQCLSETSVAHQMLMIQEDLHLPSLRGEIEGFLCKFGISDVRMFSKEGWKKFVKESCIELSRTQILSDIRTYKKLDYLELALEEFKMKDYFHELNLEFRNNY